MPDASERERLAFRGAIHDWIRDDVSLAGKFSIMPEHVDALLDKLLVALRSADPSDGAGRVDAPRRKTPGCAPPAIAAESGGGERP